MGNLIALCIFGPAFGLWIASEIFSKCLLTVCESNDDDNVEHLGRRERSKSTFGYTKREEKSVIL